MSTRTADFHTGCDGCGGRIEPNDEIVNVGGAWEHAQCGAINDRPGGYTGSPQTFPKLERAACPECHLELPVSGVCC